LIINLFSQKKKLLLLTVVPILVLVSILVPTLGPIKNPILILIHESNPKLNPISIGFLLIEPKIAKTLV
jgi:hypothetical protein